MQDMYMKWPTTYVTALQPGHIYLPEWPGVPDPETLRWPEIDPHHI